MSSPYAKCLRIKVGQHHFFPYRDSSEVHETRLDCWAGGNSSLHLPKCFSSLRQKKGPFICNVFGHSICKMPQLNKGGLEIGLS